MKCTCGVKSVFGDVPVECHADYCNLQKNQDEKMNIENENILPKGNNEKLNYAEFEKLLDTLQAY